MAKDFKEASLATDPDFARLLADSYYRLVGARLLPDNVAPRDAASWMYEEAPYCILAHNTDPDPRFVYGNIAAQTRFEYTWDELTSLPSRLSAEEVHREERQRLLDAVTRRGFETGYRGVRIAKSGKRFLMEDGTVWQLADRDGSIHGQGAVFQRWLEL